MDEGVFNDSMKHVFFSRITCRELFTMQCYFIVHDVDVERFYDSLSMILMCCMMIGTETSTKLIRLSEVECALVLFYILIAAR